MSFLSPTYLQDLRASYPSRLDRDEHRIAEFGLLTSVLQMTASPRSIISNDLKQKALNSEGRNLDVPVLKKGTVTINNVRSCAIAGGHHESDLVRVIWKTISSDIVMYPMQYNKNEIGYMDDLNAKVVELVEAWMLQMEDDIDTALDANKTTIYSSPIVTTNYSLVGDAIQVPVSKQDFFFGTIAAINFADNFRSQPAYIIGTHTLMPIVDKYMNQGAGNAVNTSYQFGDKAFRFSNQITNGEDAYATGYFMPDGTIGFLTRVDITARNRAQAGDGTEWYEDRLPGLPFTVGVQYKSKCADASTLNGGGMGHLQATIEERWQFSLDYAILTPYNSDPDTKSGAIRKFEIVPDAAEV